jgi:hypothetical protein
MFPLFRYGYKQPLQLDDLYPLDKKYLIKDFADKFDQLWKETVDKYEAERKAFEDAHPAAVFRITPRTWKEFFMFKPKPLMPPKRPSLAGVLFRIFGWQFLPIGLVSCGCF